MSSELSSSSLSPALLPLALLSRKWSLRVGARSSRSLSSGLSNQDGEVPKMENWNRDPYLKWDPGENTFTKRESGTEVHPIKEDSVQVSDLGGG